MVIQDERQTTAPLLHGALVKPSVSQRLDGRLTIEIVGIDGALRRFCREIDRHIRDTRQFG